MIETIDADRLAGVLRADGMIFDAAVMLGPETVTVFVVPQGYRPGPVLRERVIRLSGLDAARLQVVVGWTLPRTPDGRLDRGQAADMMSRPGALYRFEAPVTEAERSLVAVVAEVLDDDRRISMTDSLTDLGGDSLTAVELILRIRERFGVDIDPQRAFDAETLRDLVGILG